MSTTLVSIDGERASGSDVREKNVTAAVALANIVKSSLGPQGLDKMLVDDIGDSTITNDGATILKCMEVKDPCARVLVDLAQLQDKEVGDGTTSVVIIAAELLKKANELAKNKIHPTSIIAGFKTALKESVEYIREHLLIKVESLGREGLLNAAKTSLSSKLIGPESGIFAPMVVDAMEAVKVKDKYPLSSVHIV